MKTYLYTHEDMVYLFLQSDKNATEQTLDADAKIAAKMTLLYDTDKLRVIYLGNNEVELINGNHLFIEESEFITQDTLNEYITKVKSCVEETKASDNTDTESIMSFGKIVLTKKDIFTRLGVNNIDDVVITDVNHDKLCDGIEITFATPRNNIKDKSIVNDTKQVTRRLYLDIE